MINPKWLSGAYIVENKAVDYDSEDSFGLTVMPTNVVCTRYRQFVAKFPATSFRRAAHYFQPVIDKLEYVSPAVIGSAPYLIVEGITDYYAFKIVQEDAKAFSIMPGCGAGASGPLISWLMGRGERFLLLLDDDRAGKVAAKKYIDQWCLSEASVVTLGQLMPDLEGKRLEGLLSNDTKEAIGAALEKSSAPTKKEIGLYLAELHSREDMGLSTLSVVTKDRLRSVLAAVQDRLRPI